MSQQINLLNPTLRKQDKHFSATTMAQALGVITVGMVAFAGYAAYKTKAASALNAQAEKQFAAQRNQLLALTKDMGTTGQSGALMEEVARTEAQLKARRDL